MIYQNQWQLYISRHFGIGANIDICATTKGDGKNLKKSTKLKINIMFPRGMNNQEKEALKMVKESGLSYEVKYCTSPYSGGYIINVPLLCGTYNLDQSEPFQKDLKRYQNNLKP